ncbi:MAG: rhodanese-like domain-containing protein, partial [Planctomycetota bacterium]
PVVLVAEPGDEREAAMRLGRIGFDDVRGFLEGGMAALRDRPELVASGERVSAVELQEALTKEDGLLLLDVRTPSEWEGGHVEGSLNIPLAELTARMGEVPRDRALAVMCQSGYRSSLASSLLGREGIEGVVDAVGGIAAWGASGLPVTEVSAGGGGG